MQEDISLSKCGLKNPPQEKAYMSGSFEGFLRSPKSFISSGLQVRNQRVTLLNCQESKGDLYSKGPCLAW